LIANISGVEQDIVNRKMVLQSANTLDMPAELGWCHRRLKLRTDGSQSRVRELMSIDLFCNFFENEVIVTRFWTWTPSYV